MNYISLKNQTDWQIEVMRGWEINKRRLYKRGRDSSMKKVNKTDWWEDRNNTKCVMDLDYEVRRLIIFGSIFTTFELSIIFGGSWGCIENWVEPKIKPPLENLACPNIWNAL